jgi:hypothetical protein
MLYNLKNRTGSIALIIALSMVLILTLFFIFIDTGYLYSEKNIYQNGVEASAMAGAASLCDEDPEALAREIAVKNGLQIESLVVRVGFYDENDEYNDFPEYKDFVWEASAAYPEGEYNNAVMVVLHATEKTLMGGFAGKDEVTIGAAAVAYVKNYGMVSLDDEKGISFQGNAPVEFQNGEIHSSGDINRTDAYSFINAPLNPYSGYTREIKPMNEEILEQLRTESEVEEIVPSDFGAHPIFWKNAPYALFYQSGTPFVKPQALTDAFDPSELPLKPASVGWGLYPSADAYYIDLSVLAHGAKVFFDAQGRDDVLAIIYLKNPNPPPAEPVQGVTFMANCPILVQGKDSFNYVDSSHYGDEGDRTVSIISSKAIALKTANVYTHGVLFWTGGDFGVYGMGGSSPHLSDMARVIATGAIKVENYTEQETWSFLFSSPCVPPFIPKLGRLEVSSQEN